MSKPYRPSNGSEGLDFMATFCDRCEKDAKYRETQDGKDGCPILAASMLYDVGEEGYPKEWVVDGGSTYDDTARCTAFEEEISDEERATRTERDEMKRRGQGDLFAAPVQPGAGGEGER